MILSAQDELDRLKDRSSREFAERILDLAFEKAKPLPSADRVEAARRSLGRLIGGNLAVAMMLGRRRVLLEVGHIKKGVYSADAMRYAAQDQTLLPNVTPERAVEDMVKRQPLLVRGRSYGEVQDLLQRERGFALARSADQVVTQKVQDFIANAIRTGELLPSAEKVIAALGGWARAYGETVFRTNLGTAYSNGRWVEASDPDFEGFIVGLERVEAMDSETQKRPGHWHAHGLKAAQRDPIWLRLSCPGGYNCRGTYRLVDIYEARRERLMDGSVMRRASWPSGAYNDPGFDNKANFELFAA